MNQSQRQHIATVVASLNNASTLTSVPQQDETIRESWLRCVRHHGLEPERLRQVCILPWQQLNEHRQRLEIFRLIARYALNDLYQQVGAAGYVLLLSDAQGVATDYLAGGQDDNSLRSAGLYPGAVWCEDHAGTCGIGTALITGQPLTVHQQDHFDASHIPLTCSAAPLYDPQGQLMAVLDISALRSPAQKSSQHLALKLVTLTARRIEDTWFSHCHRDDWIIKLSPASPFVSLSPEYLLAVDTSGRIAGFNTCTRQLLERQQGVIANSPHSRSPLLGSPLEQLLDISFEQLPRELTHGRQLLLESAQGTERLYATAVAPQPVPVRTMAVSKPDNPLPPALAALNGGDAALQQQLQRAARLLKVNLNLVIHGETGSGKEYLARAFHQESPRGNQPFVALNCAAIPATLIESELFGYLPGSFSGAGSKGHQGLIQQADGGTLFLDEIGDMPLALQTRLLRVLAEGEVMPVGATRPQPVNIRVISASHHALDQLVACGEFRRDLYYRLAGARITLPPLRQRDDLDWLTDNLLAGRKLISAAARQHLARHSWPGNLRELSNVLEYALAMSDGEWIEVQDLPEELSASVTRGPVEPPGLSAEQQEGQQLLMILRQVRWNHSEAARQLGISRMTLYRRIKRFGIEPTDK